MKFFSNPARIILAKVFLLINLTSAVNSAELSRGVNEVLQINPDARSAALGGIEGPLTFRGQHIRGSEAEISQSQEIQFRLSHLSWVAESQLDGLSGVIPLDSGVNALGFGIYRFGQGDIPLVDEDEVVVAGEYRTFSVAEYILQLSYGHAWQMFRLGGSLYVLYRDVGQEGFGIRGDANGAFHFKGFRVSLRAEALTSSIATWESDHFEYEEPEAYLGLGYTQSAPYFYGQFDFLFESSGLFGEEARRRTGVPGDDRLFENPQDAFLVSKLAIEYLSTNGLSLRLGLPVIRDYKYLSMGAGYQYKNLLGADYAVDRHPELGLFHRFSLTIGWNVFSLLQ